MFEKKTMICLWRDPVDLRLHGRCVTETEGNALALEMGGVLITRDGDVVIDLDWATEAIGHARVNCPYPKTPCEVRLPQLA